MMCPHQSSGPPAPPGGGAQGLHPLRPHPAAAAKVRPRWGGAMVGPTSVRDAPAAADCSWRRRSGRARDPSFHKRALCSPLPLQQTMPRPSRPALLLPAAWLAWDRAAGSRLGQARPPRGCPAAPLGPPSTRQAQRFRAPVRACCPRWGNFTAALLARSSVGVPATLRSSPHLERWLRARPSTPCPPARPPACPPANPSFRSPNNLSPP